MPVRMPPAAEDRRPLYHDKSLQVFAGMVFGALIGAIWPQTAPWMSTLADLFIRLIAMFVGIIIFCSVVHGIATVREARRVGRVAIKALIYFEVVTTFALIIGLAMINLLGPGRGMQVDQATGVDLSLTQQIGLLGILLITSKGGAGVAGSAIVVLVSTLAATGVIPVAAVALILGVHRLLSSAFVAVNILGNALATIVIGQWEGAVDRALLVAGLAETNSAAATPAILKRELE